jgi:murein tripeptide amidase MpaA
MKVSVAVATLLLGTAWLLAQDDKPGGSRRDSGVALFPSGYLGHDALSAALKKVAEAHPDAVRLRSLARSAGGRDVWLATIERPAAKDAAPRPAILIVANLEADHLVGSQVALGLVERLAEADKDLTAILDRATIHVVPRLNPDGAEKVLTSPRSDFRTNLQPLDRDRDGRKGEDGPDDLDGDGLALRMRVKDDKATLVADAKDDRILRKAELAKGERAVYSEYAEGKDDDGDGSVNEDPPGGVNLNRNWPHRWTEFDPEAGSSPASEPEVRALIQFAFDHPEIAAVWSFGLNDNLKAEPRKPGSTLDDADLPLFAELSRQANKAAGPAAKDQGKSEPTGEAKKDEPAKAEAEPPKAAPAEDQAKATTPAKGQRGGGGRGGARGGGPAPLAPSAPTTTPPGASSLDGTTDGAVSEWAYHQFGVVGLASRLWTGPDLPEPAKGQPAPPAEGEARWLYWNDQVVGGRAFASFKPFDHPSLGKVEIGGWKPGVRVNPSADAIPKITDAQLAFLKELAGRLPALAIADVKVEPKGGGLYQVSAAVTNDGYLPTALAQGVRVRKAPPVLVRLKVGEGKILAGKALNRVDALPGSGGRREFRWLISAPEGTRQVTLEASTAKAGRATKTIDLR